DGIRDRNVTGVQTCALPILGLGWRSLTYDSSSSSNYYYEPFRRTARLSASNNPGLGDGAAASVAVTLAANAVTVGGRRPGSRSRPCITAASSPRGKRRPGTASFSGVGSRS